MAIAMAKSGGIGILHRFLSVDEQCAQVRKVKRAEAFIIEDPYTISEDESLSAVRERIRVNGVKSLLVTDRKTNTLCGIITNRDLRFVEENDARKVRDLMTPKQKLRVHVEKSGKRMTPEEAQKLMQENRLEKLPLIDEQWNIRGLITSRDLYHYLNNPYATHDKNHQLLVGAAIGVKDGDLERALRLVDAGVDCIVVDIAHGHSDLAMKQVKALRKHLPKTVDIIAGNVATGAAAVDLVECGADSVKVGVGPGSICTTRIVTGCGVPQLSAILDVATELKKAGSDVPIIADGGIKTSGDITKALAAGAHTVMLGNLLAGTEESPGQTLVKNGKKVKIIRGMAGYGANISNREKQQMKKDDIFDVVPEGVEAQVPYRGRVKDIVHQLCGGLASGISYCGAFSIPEMQKNARFLRITGAGKRESGAHDVELIN